MIVHYCPVLLSDDNLQGVLLRSINARIPFNSFSEAGHAYDVFELAGYLLWVRASLSEPYRLFKDMNGDIPSGISHMPSSGLSEQQVPY